MEVLDFDVERDLLRETLREAGRGIHLRFDFATTIGSAKPKNSDSWDRTNLTFRCLFSCILPFLFRAPKERGNIGCRAIHYSGHGNPDCLSFEDGMGGLHIVQADTLRRLCAAGRGRGRCSLGGQAGRKLL